MKTYLENGLVFFDARYKIYVLLTNPEALQGCYINVKGKRFEPEERNILTFSERDLMPLTEPQVSLLDKLQGLRTLPICKAAALGDLYVNTRKNIYFLPDANSVAAIHDETKTVALGWHVDEFGDPVEATQTVVAINDLRSVNHEEAMFIVALAMLEEASLDDSSVDAEDVEPETITEPEKPIVSEAPAVIEESSEVDAAADMEETKTEKPKRQAKANATAKAPKPKASRKAKA